MWFLIGICAVNFSPIFLFLLVFSVAFWVWTKLEKRNDQKFVFWSKRLLQIFSALFLVALLLAIAYLITSGGSLENLFLNFAPIFIFAVMAGVCLAIIRRRQ
jgi:hypothetical protein